MRIGYTYEELMELNKFILEDEGIKLLLKEKTKLLNSLTPKYLFNKETNTATAIFDKKEVELLNKIDLLIKNRVDEIKGKYK